MPQENVELIRRVNEAFNRGDWDGMLANFTGNFEYVTSGMIPGAGGVYRGIDNYRRVFLEGVWGEFDDLHSEINEIIPSKEQVLFSLTIRGRGKRSGAETNWSFFQVWTVREGKVTQGRGFLHRSDALEALGLSEQDAHGDS